MSGWSAYLNAHTIIRRRRCCAGSCQLKDLVTQIVVKFPFHFFLMLIAHFLLVTGFFIQKVVGEGENFTRSITYFTQTDQDYYDHFTRVIYSPSSWNFDQVDLQLETRKYYIINPYRSIEYVGRKYYWNETYIQNLEKVQKLCEYRFHDFFDKKFCNTFYRNGTKPTSLLFACSWYQKCSGLQCEIDLPRLPYILVTPLLLYAIYRWLRHHYQKYRMVPKQRSRHPAALDNIPVPFVSPPVPPQNPDLPPAYSSLTSQDCSLPSYETVVSGKVQYMYPSYSNVSN